MANRLGFLSGLVAAGGVLTLAFAPCAAQTKIVQEDSLLGIKLLSSHKTVLERFRKVYKKWQPDEIQVGEPTVSGDSTASQNKTGGSGKPGMAGGPGKPGMMGGPGMMGPPGMMGGGSPYGGGGGGNPFSGGGSPYGGAGRGKGLPGFPGAGGSSIPGMSGGGSPYGGGGAPSMMGPPGMAGGGSGGAGGEGASQEEDPGETTWWYHFPKEGRHISILFNKEGKVIQIQQYGWKSTDKTRMGIALGASLGDILKKYGWSSNGMPVGAGDDLVLRYGGQRKVMFQLVKNRVVGISVGLVK